MATGLTTEAKRSLRVADVAHPFPGECRSRHPRSVQRHPHRDLADVR